MPSIVSILPAADLAAQHEARADEPAVQRDAAGAAVAGGAAFLAAGQVQRVAEDVEQRLLRLAEELDRVSVHRSLRRDAWPSAVLARSSAINAARRASTPATSTRNSIVPRLSSIGRHAARAAASSRCLRRLVEPAADDRLRGLRHQQHPRGHRAERHARRGDRAGAVDGQAHARAHHGDVHLGARDEARYASAERGGRGGSRNETTISPFCSASLRGPSITSSTGRSRLPCGPASVATRARRDERGHAVRRRRAVAEVAAERGASLHLRRADEVRGLDHARPRLLEPRVLLQLGARHRGADAPAALLLGDRAGLGDLLDVDDQLRARRRRRASGPGGRCLRPARAPRPSRLPRRAARPRPPTTPGLSYRMGRPSLFMLCAA